MVSGFFLTNTVVFLTENGIFFFVLMSFSSINLTDFSIFWIHHPIFFNIMQLENKVHK